MSEAEAIVRALAEFDPVRVLDGNVYECVVCDATGLWRPDGFGHVLTCPWLRAVAWVAHENGAPSAEEAP